MVPVLNEYYHISAAGTYQVFSGACVLESVVVNTPSAGIITIIDNTTGVAPVIAALVASVTSLAYTYNTTMGLGIRIIVAGANPDITIIYRSN